MYSQGPEDCYIISDGLCHIPSKPANISHINVRESRSGQTAQIDILLVCGPYMIRTILHRIQPEQLKKHCASSAREVTSGYTTLRQ